MLSWLVVDRVGLRLFLIVMMGTLEWYCLICGLISVPVMFWGRWLRVRGLRAMRRLSIVLGRGQISEMLLGET